MSFLSDSEFIILMDTIQDVGYRLTVDDLKRLRDAGVQTAWWHGTRFDDWKDGYIDDYLERVGQAGMKAIIPLWNKIGAHHSDNWYARAQGFKPFPEILSPWNKTAQDWYNLHLKAIVKQYASPTCLIISSQCRDGEYVMPSTLACFDEAAIADWRATGHAKGPADNAETNEWLKKRYTKLLVDQQKIVIEQPDREIWFMLSWRKAQECRPDLQANNTHHWCYGCEWISDYLEAWKKLKPKAINHLSYNYIPFGKIYWDKIRWERETYGVQEWGGSEYAEGLRDGNAQTAIDHGLRGLFCGPVHPYTKHDKLEDWMLIEIKKANKLFEQRRQNVIT